MANEKVHNSAGSTAPIRHRRAQGARPVLGRPSRRPLSVAFEQQTAGSRQQTADRRSDSCSDARSPLWISQLTRTKTNLNLEWLDRFEGGVVSACASLRRCAAAPLRRSAAPPLRRSAAPPLSPLASRSLSPLASHLSSRREIVHLSLANNNSLCRSGVPLLHPLHGVRT